MVDGGAQLPLISLANLQVPPAVLQIIPQQTAVKFEVIAYEENQTQLKLAIVRPELLKPGFYAALQQIGTKIGKTVELSQIKASDFAHLIAQYGNAVKAQEESKVSHGDVQPTIKPTGEHVEKKVETTPVAPIKQAAAQRVVVVAPPEKEAPAGQHLNLPKQPTIVPIQVEDEGWPIAPVPPLFELGKLVAYNYLKRIPLDFAKKHHVLSVDYLKPNTYWFVTDGSNDPALKKVITYMQDTNHIKAHVIIIKPQEFSDLMAYYEMLAAQEMQETIQEEKDRAKEEKEEENELVEQKLRELNSPVTEDELPKKVAKDVIVPEIQAKIISNEEEKSGLAGLFQKVAQSFAAQEAEKALPDDTLPIQQVVLPAPAQTAATVASAPTSSSSSAASAAQPTNSDATQSAAPLPPAPVAPATPVAQGSTPATSQPAAAPAPAAKSTAQPVTATRSRSTGEEGEDIGKLLEAQIRTVEELRSIIRGGAIPRMVAGVVSFAIHEKASDIHIESFEDEVRVRYRIDGQLMDIIKLPPDVHNSLVSRIKILSRLRLDENRIPQDGRFEVNFSEEIQIDVRVSVMPTVHGEKVVMRILDKSRGIASLEKLGIEGMAYNTITQAIQKPYGICLATGPTGSGKSTSLYAILQRIATPNVNVVTLEDPIEYEMKGVNQSQIRPKIGYTFAEGLRSILRQDPNIIMVGEIRDGETANMATQSALTGHLVLSTLHTNDAAGSIPRLTNMGIEPFLITSSLNMVMAQRLVRKICQNCKKEINLPAGIRKQLEEDIEKIAQLNELDARRIKRPITFYQGAGCTECNGKGYQGRIGIYEVLAMDDDIADLTIARVPSGRIAEAARAKGMLTLYQDGLLKAINGITTIDEVLRESTNK